MHEAVEHFWSTTIASGNPPRVEDVVGRFEAMWSRNDGNYFARLDSASAYLGLQGDVLSLAPFASKWQHEKMFSNGRHYLRMFHQRCAAMLQEGHWWPQATEHQFELKLEKCGVNLIGILDLVLKSTKNDQEGKEVLRLVEYKSNKVGEKGEQAIKRMAKTSLQPVIYSMALKETQNVAPENLSTVVESIESGYHSPVKTGSLQEKRLLHTIETVADGVRQHKFDPTPGFFQCSFCSVRASCRHRQA